MSDNPPFMNAYGTITKILSRVKDAKTPERFTQDFLGTVLKCPGGSARPFIAFAKRIGLLGADGSPTELYKRFRNPSESGAAIAEAIRKGYAELYKRNEYVHELDRPKLKGLVTEVTGQEGGSTVVKSVVGSFEALRSLASFDGSSATRETINNATDEERAEPKERRADPAEDRPARLGLAYTINIQLPNTDDPAVFNAIFKALRNHVL